MDLKDDERAGGICIARIPPGSPSTLGVHDAKINPEHYAQWPIQPIQFIMTNDLPYWMGNVIKYVMRSNKKGGIEDLMKAKEYIDIQIRYLEAKEKE